MVRLFRFLVGVAVAAVAVGGTGALLGTCGPFTDVAADAFCPFVLEIFTLAITTGTTATTYDPTGNVTRLQMAAFLSRTVDRVLQRGSKRAALQRFWSPGTPILGVTSIGTGGSIEYDGEDLWVAGIVENGPVSRVSTSDGRVLGTWTGVDVGTGAGAGVLAAMGRIFVTGATSPGKLYGIDPTLPPGLATTLASNLGVDPVSIAFDGARLWTADVGPTGSVSVVTPGATIPWTVTTVLFVFASPSAILYDGTNIWVTDIAANKLLRLDASGAILQTVTVGQGPRGPVFDGSSIWVPNGSSVSVVRASSGALLATLTGNGLDLPTWAACDGQRVLVVNKLGGSVSLWKAADLTPQGSVAIGTSPVVAASDGVDFWVALGSGSLVRF